MKIRIMDIIIIIRNRISIIRLKVIYLHCNIIQRFEYRGTKIVTAKKDLNKDNKFHVCDIENGFVTVISEVSFRYLRKSDICNLRTNLVFFFWERRSLRALVPDGLHFNRVRLYCSM